LQQTFLTKEDESIIYLIMRIIFLILIYLGTIDVVVSKDKSLQVKELLVMKRNKPQCDRLGNVYDACQWMLKFTLINNTKNSLRSFCSVLQIEEKKYELCSRDKYYIKPKDKKVILSNLSELISYKNDDPRPFIRIISIKGKYVKDKP